jgi:uncharacterized membrane protein YagU involved in acid resistance
MATETATATDAATDRQPSWQRGVAGGVLGGIVFGVMVSVMMTPVIEKAIPAMYGLSGGMAGWVIHVSHGAVLGVAFAAVARDRFDSLGETVVAGAVYGVALWALLAVVVMPVWLQTVGFGGAPAVPNVSPKSLVGHAVYGVALGAVFAALD